MKKVFGILCHQVTNPLIHTINYLARFSENTIIIHVDNKSDIMPFEYLKQPNVHFLKNRVNVYWGHVSQIEATLRMLKYCNDFEYDYFFLLSGDDIPLQTNSKINEVLEEFSDFDFIDCNDETNIVPEDRVRFNYPSFFYTKQKTFLIRAKKLAVYKTRKIFFRNKKFDNCRFKIPKMYKGAQWFTFKKSTVTYILNYLRENSWFYPLFEKSICADEIFFHTIFKTNSNLKIFKHKNFLNSELRYIDWQSGPEYPKILTDRDRVSMRQSNCFFARKLAVNANKNFMESFLN